MDLKSWQGSSCFKVLQQQDCSSFITFVENDSDQGGKYIPAQALQEDNSKHPRLHV